MHLRNCQDEHTWICTILKLQFCLVSIFWNRVGIFLSGSVILENGCFKQDYKVLFCRVLSRNIVAVRASEVSINYLITSSILNIMRKSAIQSSYWCSTFRKVRRTAPFGFLFIFNTEDLAQHLQSCFIMIACIWNLSENNVSI